MTSDGLPGVSWGLSLLMDVTAEIQDMLRNCIVFSISAFMLVQYMDYLARGLICTHVVAMELVKVPGVVILLVQ